METRSGEGRDFIRQIIAEDLRTGARDQVVTRFPPEPNGYLHIGHAKSICLNFGVAQENGGRCHLRFDDTNPETEDMQFVRSIQEDIRWLGFDWGDYLYFASDYFEQLYQWAVQLVEAGKAYVDDLNDEEIRAYRGTVTEPGRESPYRSRSVAENLDLLARMRAGEFPDGAKVLRAKIDMAHPNMKMRDPLMYRIRHATHYRTGDDWCIYPMYDWAHGQSDAIEGITHSICTLEFENNRELYDWFLENLGISPRPYQYEFARLNLDFTVMSKRKLLLLVNEGHVSGWDDPRMLTIAGLRRRGYTPEAIRNFAEGVGVAKVNSRAEFELLEYHVRDDLNHRAPRVMAVLRPLKVVITNYPEDRVEELEASYWPHDVPKEGSRVVPFSKEIYVERDDFMEEPTDDFHRLSPGSEVRLRYGYIIKCDEVVKDADGQVVELRCTYDPETQSGSGGRRVRGTVHWVSAAHALPAEVRLYDRLFRTPNPDDVAEGQSFKENLNPNSMEVLTDAVVEPSLAGVVAGDRFQFERQGYFVADMVDSTPERPVFNRIVTLRDTWGKKSQAAPPRPERGKEKAPEPVVVGSKSDLREQARAANPELAARHLRYEQELGLSEEDADILTGDMAMADFFEATLTTKADPRTTAKWITNELLGAVKDRSMADLPFDGVRFGELVALIDQGAITNTIGKDVLDEMLRTGAAPAAIVEEKGLTQIADAAALEPLIREIMAANPEKLAAYRSGKKGLFGFFMGQIMGKTRGKANPQVAKEVLTAMLEDGTES